MPIRAFFFLLVARVVVSNQQLLLSSVAIDWRPISIGLSLVSYATRLRTYYSILDS